MTAAPRPTSRLATRAKAVAKWAVALGAASAAVLGLAWEGWLPHWLPGGHRLRVWMVQQHNVLLVQGFAREAKSVPAGTVVFLGSSTIAGFPLDRLYPGAPCLNRGLGGDTTPGLLRRLDASLPVARPSGFVIYSGANDLRADLRDPAAIVASTVTLLDALSARAPGVPVALVETMPIRDPPPGDPERLATLNEGLRALAEARGAAFVRTNRPPIADATGHLSKDLTRDGEHLNDAGYDVLAKWIAEDGGAAVAALHRR